MSVKITEDAVGFDFTFQCVNVENADTDEESTEALDLSSSTVTLYFRKIPGTTSTGPYTCTISDATAGLATYTTVGTEVTSGGPWKGQLKFHTASKTIGSDTFALDVIGNLF